MPTPIITLPIHTIEQARALAGLLRAYIDGQSPDTNDGEDWKPDPEFEGICAIAAHLDAGIAGALETDAQYKARHDAAVKAERGPPILTGTLVEAGELFLAGYDGEIDSPISGILIEMDKDNLRAAAGSLLGATVEIRRPV